MQRIVISFAAVIVFCLGLAILAADIPMSQPAADLAAETQALFAATEMAPMQALVKRWKEKLSQAECKQLIVQLLRQLGSNKKLKLAHPERVIVSSTRKPEGADKGKTIVRQDVFTEGGRAAWAVEQFLDCRLPIIPANADDKTKEDLIRAAFENVMAAMLLPPGQPVVKAPAAPLPPLLPLKKPEVLRVAVVDADFPLPSSQWKVGLGWRVVVTIPPKAPNPVQPDSDKAFRFTGESREMHIIVAGNDRIDKTDCWRVFLIPILSPGKLGTRYRIAVAKEDGLVRQATREEDFPIDTLLDPYADHPIQIPPPPGIPLEVFPPLARTPALQGAKDSPKWTLTKKIKGEEIVVEASIPVDKDNVWTIRETWRKGEPWWNSYERRHNGVVDLEAHPYTPEKTQPAAAPPPATPSKPASPVPSPPKPPPVDPLMTDERLCRPVTAHFNRHTLREVLDVLALQTSVPLEMEEALEQQRPLVGRLDLNQTPAWTVMRQLVRGNVSQGRWEKKPDGGYRLIGTSPVLSAPPETPRTPSRSPSWWLLLVVIPGGILALWNVLRVRRRAAGDTD